MSGKRLKLRIGTRSTGINTSDFATVKKRLFLQLANAEKHQRFLETIPHMLVGNTDLAVIFHVHESTKREVINSFIVSYDMANQWGIGTEPLYEAALKNMQTLFPFTLRSMESLLSRPFEADQEGILPGRLEPGRMYVLSIKERFYGASVILYPDLLDRLGRRFGGNFFILPSSVHEVILMKDEGDLDPDELRQTISAINQEKVAPEDVLSDGVFYYDVAEHSLSSPAPAIYEKEGGCGLYDTDSLGLMENEDDEEWER